MHKASRIYRNGDNKRDWYDPNDPEDEPMTVDWFARELMKENPEIFSKIAPSESLENYLNKCRNLGPEPRQVVRDWLD